MIAVLIAKIVGACHGCARRMRRPARRATGSRTGSWGALIGAGAGAGDVHLASARRCAPRHETPSEGDAVARVDVVMPQMGESIAEGTLSKWLKKVGDTVKRDEPIFEISTDKVDAEIPAPSAACSRRFSSRKGRRLPVQTRGRAARDGRERGGRRGAPPPAPAPAAAPAAAAAGGPAATASCASRAAAPAPVRRTASRSARQPTAATRSRSASARSRRRSCDAWPPSTASRSARCRAAASPAASRRRDLVEFLESGAEGAGGAAGAARRRCTRRRGARARTVRCRSRGPATASSRCRRCARSSASTWCCRAHVGARQLVLRGRLHAHRAHPRRRTARSSSGRRARSSRILPFIIKAVTDALKRVPGAQRGGARQRDHLSQADQHRHRGRARLGAHRSGHQERRQPVADRAHAIAQRPRRPRAHEEARSARGAGRRRSRSPTPACSAR